MCGIFAISAKENIIEELFIGTFYLQSLCQFKHDLHVRPGLMLRRYHCRPQLDVSLFPRGPKWAPPEQPPPGPGSPTALLASP